MPEYREPYVSEERDGQDKSQYEGQDQDLGRFHEKQATSSKAASETSSSTGLTGVSPELIALLSAKIKSDILEDLRNNPIDHNHLSASSKPGAGHRRDSSTTLPKESKRTSHTLPVQSRQTASSRSPPTQYAFETSPNTLPREGRAKRRESSAATSSDGDNNSKLSRTFSTAELSILDQKWGALFDNAMEPTERLGQIFRGIANHINYEFEPRGSIVLTPSKMIAFYTKYAIEKEPHPLLDIFRTESYASLSKLYGDLHCEQHLISSGAPDILPTVPALTPNGFANWMTLLTMSYPEVEHARLNKIVSELPIDACGRLIDGKPERLPKQLSRHLLPNYENSPRRAEVCRAITSFMHDAGLTKRSSRDGTSFQTTPNKVNIAQVDVPTSRPLERERKPYVRHPSYGESAIEDDEPLLAGANIERQRQPYTAMPGNGKMHIEESQRIDEQPPDSRRDRFNSNRSSMYDLDDEYPIPIRRESRAARAYAPELRSNTAYRNTSPSKTSKAPSNSEPYISNSNILDRDDRHSPYHNVSTTFATPAYTNDLRDRERHNSVESSSRRERAEAVLVRERERERDRARLRNEVPSRLSDRERERERERVDRKPTARARRDTADSNSRPDSSAQSGGLYERTERSEKDDYGYARY